MRYAVIQTGGKQYRVSEGDVITVERLPLDVQAEFVCAEVLFLQDNGALTFGSPYIENINVHGTVLEHVKGDKLRIGKYKAKVRYRRVTGHRQSLSKVQITRIGEVKKQVAK